MIIIKTIVVEDIVMPERELTPDEQLTVTSVMITYENYIYYQGDEPLQE
jgi:hypothetical protein